MVSNEASPYICRRSWRISIRIRPAIILHRSILWYWMWCVHKGCWNTIENCVDSKRLYTQYGCWLVWITPNRSRRNIYFLKIVTKIHTGTYFSLNISSTYQCSLVRKRNERVYFIALSPNQKSSNGRHLAVLRSQTKWIIFWCSAEPLCSLEVVNCEQTNLFASGQIICYSI